MAINIKGPVMSRVFLLSLPYTYIYIHMQTFILRTIGHSGEAHNTILGSWYAVSRLGQAEYEKIEKANPFNLAEDDALLCVIKSAQANETFLFKKSTEAAYVMTENGTTFECLFSFS